VSKVYYYSLGSKDHDNLLSVPKFIIHFTHGLTFLKGVECWYRFELS
jgi:hypothetical protein